jgi:hypothetical protein
MVNEVPLYFFNQTNASEIAALIGLAILCISLAAAPWGFKGWYWGVSSGIYLQIPDAIWVLHEQKAPIIIASAVPEHATLVLVAFLGPVGFWLLGGFAAMMAVLNLRKQLSDHIYHRGN